MPSNTAAFPSRVNTAANHEAYLVKQPGLKKRSVDMSAANDSETLHSELFAEYFHRLGEVDAVLAAGNP